MESEIRILQILKLVRGGVFFVIWGKMGKFGSSSGGARTL